MLLHKQIAYLNLFFRKEEFPESWGQHTNKGAHVLSVKLEDVKKVALERAIQKLNELKEDEFIDSEDDDDSENSYGREFSPFSSFTVP